MTRTSPRSGASATLTPGTLLRFDRVERFAHWANATLVGVLMLTALPLYFPSIEAVIGRRFVVEQIHLFAGLALPVPLVLSLLGSWGRRLRADLRRCALWTKEETRWLRTMARNPLRRPDKFNPGQKLNALFIAGALLVLLGTGLMLKWFSPFPLSWRSGATLVHDTLAFLVFAVVIGHIAMALTHREALKSMFTGKISIRWAERHAAGWLSEEQPEP